MPPESPVEKTNQPTTVSLAPPEAWEPLLRALRIARKPLDHFLHIQAASGILLLLTAAVALIWANSPWAHTYDSLWQTTVGFSLGDLKFERSLVWIVNDVLMVIFFFVVGLEIRREIYQGELSQFQRATLPVAAAIGGMLLPAILYLAIAGDPATKSGWGVPMATDIAFAVGILTLLGNRAPPALRVLLLAVAVIDDLGAILVIAFFYSSGISISGVLIALLGFSVIFLMQRLAVRAKIAYVAPAAVAWAGIYAAGIHPTIAGVLVGFMTPVKAWLGPWGYLQKITGDMELIDKSTVNVVPSHDLAVTLRHLKSAQREVLSPTDSLIESLHPWVAFVIMPIFALANAGVPLADLTFDARSSTVIVAVCVGLILGKPLGILLFSWLAIKLRLASLPVGITFKHLLVLGIVAGVGFTMALFIGQLAFSDVTLLGAAKLGILIASGVAAVLALISGRLMLSTNLPAGTAQTADDAESSTDR